MQNQENKIIKLCSFYVSDWHIVTMILPYINSSINENIKIIPFFQNNVKNNLTFLLNRLNLKNKEKILNINWSLKDNIKYEEINNIINEYKKEKLLIIVNGNKEYIENVNKVINKSINKNNNKKDLRIKILNCYEVIEFNNNIKEILDSHDKILNTSGERNIEEIYEGYSKKSS